jgi:hypothetical protein
MGVIWTIVLGFVIGVIAKRIHVVASTGIVCRFLGRSSEWFLTGYGDHLAMAEIRPWAFPRTVSCVGS